MKSIEGVLKFLAEIGLDFYESKVYLSLIEYGKQTVYELSKSTKISRTNVYRIVERLKSLGLIEEKLVFGRKYLVSAGDEKLELLVREQEAKSNLLKTILPEIKALFRTNSNLRNPDYEIINYKGYEGVREVIFNLLSTKDELRCYVSRDILEVLDEDDSKLWLDEFKKRTFLIKEIVTENYLLGIKASRTNRNNNDGSRIETRSLPRSDLEIHFLTYIFNNQIAYVSWKSEIMFATEVFTERFSSLEKQKFDLIWKNCGLV
ncbi:TrmB family transcriptional regulator [Candidatus Dojkabacteria bacterium]|uniref:TrmB family transcriptional regulator n=1 Tax=Candidatus Dojkabacteria bacterium TaxID=2099670 RepID=A0A3M0YXV6_9BACT|nr:MAG: TrmB family transcriptional regulator [Candidatus Dojkabacteria bacterium]